MSFYGGRRGASFEIVKRYATYDEMVNDIKNIDYNQYVIVEDGNKVYRKTTEGYIYILSVDPANISTSLASSLALVDYVTVEEQKSASSYSEGAAQISDSTQTIIKYNSVVDSSGKTLMGFSFPSYSFDFELDKDSNETSLKKVDDGTNPFYAKWLLSIEHLIGRSFTNLRIVNSNSVTNTVYSSLDYTTVVTLPKNTMIILYDIVEEEQKTIYLGTFNSITNINISDTGLLSVDTLENSLTYQFTDISTIALTDGILSITYKDGTSTELSLNYPTNISLKNDYALYAEYADGTNKAISEPINYIIDAKINDGHLLIKFTDSNYLIEKQVDGYVDYGSIKSDSGLLIGKNYTIEEIPSSYLPFSIVNSISFLNATYPNGLTGNNLEGKIITIGNTYDEKYFFAFDYSKTTWYFLMSSSNVKQANLIAPYTTEGATAAEQLPVGGIWFIEETQI